MFIKYYHEGNVAITELKSIKIFEKEIEGRVIEYDLYVNHSDFTRQFADDVVSRLAGLLTDPADYRNRFFSHRRVRGYREDMAVSISDIESQEWDKDELCQIACFKDKKDANDAVNTLCDAIANGDKIFDMCKLLDEAWDRYEGNNGHEKEEVS